MTKKMDDWAESIVDYEKVDTEHVETIVESATSDELVALYHQLIKRKRDVEAQMSERSAEVDIFQQKCLTGGPGGKAEWFKEFAAFKLWKAKANRYKTYVESLLSQVKRRMKTENVKISSQRSDEDRKECFKLLREAQILLASNDTARNWRERVEVLLGEL